MAGWQRAKADLINYKKEEAERNKAWTVYLTAIFSKKLIDILDNLDRAEKEVPEDQKEDAVVKGFLQIGNQMREFLKNEGIKELGVKAGDTYDTNFHEVVAEVETEGKNPGEIVEVLSKGYLLQDQLLRAAKVKVAK